MPFCGGAINGIFPSSTPVNFVVIAYEMDRIMGGISAKSIGKQTRYLIIRSLAFRYLLNYQELKNRSEKMHSS